MIMNAGLISTSVLLARPINLPFWAESSGKIHNETILIIKEIIILVFMLNVSSFFKLVY